MSLHISSRVMMYTYGTSVAHTFMVYTCVTMVYTYGVYICHQCCTWCIHVSRVLHTRVTSVAHIHIYIYTYVTSDAHMVYTRMSPMLHTLFMTCHMCCTHYIYTYIHMSQVKHTWCTHMLHTLFMTCHMCCTHFLTDMCFHVSSRVRVYTYVTCVAYTISHVTCVAYTF